MQTYKIIKARKAAAYRHHMVVSPGWSLGPVVPWSLSGPLAGPLVPGPLVPCPLGGPLVPCLVPWLVVPWLSPVPLLVPWSLGWSPTGLVPWSPGWSPGPWLVLWSPDILAGPLVPWLAPSSPGWPPIDQHAPPFDPPPASSQASDDAKQRDNEDNRHSHSPPENVQRLSKTSKELLGIRAQARLSACTPDT